MSSTFCITVGQERRSGEKNTKGKRRQSVKSTTLNGILPTAQTVNVDVF
jgi:hypothetical protein